MVPNDSYRRRLVDNTLDELLKQLPAVSVIGPRAAGKTTTLERRAATVVHLDDTRQALAFRLDPAAALRKLDEPVLLDEWQAVPEVLGAVRRAVDADWRPGRFLISGSVRAAFRHPVWPGTGRIVELAMHPMTVREQRGEHAGAGFIERLMAGQELTAPRDSPDLRGYVELAVQSGFPRAVTELEGPVRARWLRSYVANLVTHDLEQLQEPVTRSRDPQRLRRYLAAFALNSRPVWWTSGPCMRRLTSAR